MEERTRTRARALAHGVEAQMLSLGATPELARAWRDWTYETVVETVELEASPAWLTAAASAGSRHGASVS